MRRIVHRLIAVLTLVIFALVQRPLPSHAAPSGNVWYFCQLHLDRATATRVVRRVCHTYAMPREHRTRIGWTIRRTRVSPHVEHSVRFPRFYVAPPPATTLTGFIPAVTRWAPEIDYAARVTGMPSRFIAAIMMVESAGDPNATSYPYLGRSDVGLMQISYDAAVQVGGQYTYSPAENILTGALILAWMDRNCSGGSLYNTAAHYNAGCYGYSGAYAAKVWSYYA